MLRVVNYNLRNGQWVQNSTMHIPCSAFCCTSYYTAVSTKYCRRFPSDHNHNPKTLPRKLKHVPESTKSVLGSRKYFGFLWVFLNSWNCFWILGRVLDSGMYFWILGSVLDAGCVLDFGTCFVPRRATVNFNNFS